MEKPSFSKVVQFFSNLENYSPINASGSWTCSDLNCFKFSGFVCVTTPDPNLSEASVYTQNVHPFFEKDSLMAFLTKSWSFRKAIECSTPHPRSASLIFLMDLLFLFTAFRYAFSTTSFVSKMLFGRRRPFDGGLHYLVLPLMEPGIHIFLD